MRALVCEAFGEREALRVGDLPDPGAPGPGEVRIRVTAAGVNFADLLMVAGQYQVKPPLPFAPGFEIAGRIEAVGPGVDGLASGAPVMAFLDHGGFAEVAIAPVDMVFPVPDGMSEDVAAGFPIAYGTSHLGLVEKAGLKRGEVLLVHGAAGGVGLAAVEIGKAAGATVIATAGGPDKCRIALDHGADHAIDYRSQDLKDAVKALAIGADVVFDPVGGKVFETSLRVANWNARLLVVGFAGGEAQKIPANILLVKNVSAIGFYFGSYRRRRPDLVRATFAGLDRMWRDGQLRPRVADAFDLADFERAFDLIRSRGVVGKLVLAL